MTALTTWTVSPRANEPAVPGWQAKSVSVVASGRVPPIDGGPLWAELHRRALAWPGGEDAAWLAKFRLRVPCGECRGHWDGMLKRTPPVWADYFAWTVARHNEVNRRLGKPELSLVEARERWVL